MIKHGVYGTEVSTSTIPAAIAASGVPVVFGTAPINLSKRTTLPFNVPVLCSSFDEAVEAFGYSDNWEEFTLCEFIYSHFKLYAGGSVVLVNVLNPSEHKLHTANELISVVSKKVKLEDTGILPQSVAIDSADHTLAANEYTLSFDEVGKLIIQITADLTETEFFITYDRIDPTKVVSTNVIAGLDLVDEVYPRFRMLPGIVIAPGWSHIKEVGIKMVEKSTNINGHFRCLTITDVPTETVMVWSGVKAWKDANFQSSNRQMVCWPLVTRAGRVYHFSTHAASLIAETDADNQAVPFVSPSNKTLQVDGAILADGVTKVFLGPDQAATLNSGGVVTALNFIGGWKLWGNRTAAYPDSAIEPKDAFIPVRRMFDWLNNTITLKYWERLDGPITKRLVEAITDEVNLWLNGLTAVGVLTGGRVEFNASENPSADILDGKLKFHIYATPPSPAEQIEFVIEYDAQYLGAITGGATA
ncbi:phage tail sheath family protein [Tumebacillus permanentifrigoris]|uniref:Tail sheath protein C-terminal domain-containing protein n=1 Tax=Tumebacillus permanentifrigoris TaxID=378543 RepID=A0A316DDH5_9BACL|nr:phage tail sheath C-terminal domain-containing protein [Tumebacillus permanentifrigoris]PWK16064.1 hypothetical protein C7459_102311 [Tumebacillus permanentifrigoris]